MATEQNRPDDTAIPIPPAAREESHMRATTLIIYYSVLSLASVGVIVFLPDLRGAGVIALAVAFGLAPIALRRVSAPASTGPDMHTLMRGFEQLGKRLDTLVREGGLSEAAKHVLHRREERNLLRGAIEQDVADEDWEAAMVLVRELAERFGYRADAEEFRGRIERARAETLDRHVTDAVARLDAMLEAKRWEDASREAARIERLYPDSPRVETLGDRVGQAKQKYKVDLQRRFLHAAQREEVDHAMKLLKQLDDYLTDNEAERLREVARGVVGKARDNLGARFKLLIEDKDWVQALRAGERIIKEFPNTRMADEVRESLDLLRSRAGQAAPSAGAP